MVKSENLTISTYFITLQYVNLKTKLRKASIHIANNSWKEKLYVNRVNDGIRNFNLFRNDLLSSSQQYATANLFSIF